MTAPGWYPDPLGRADHRYWDGETWTEQVSRQGIVGTDPPIVAGPTAEVARAPVEQRKYRGHTLNAWFWIALGVLSVVALTTGVIVRQVGGNDEQHPFTATTAYEGCRQAIENRGGSAPDLPTDFGVHTDTVTTGVYEFTVKDTYHCTVTRLSDGKIDVATSSVP